jgi:multidrug resistance protein MdtO
LASQAQLQLAEIETDIDLAGYEPSRIRPDAMWLATRRKAVDEIGALGSPLLLSADKDATTSAQIAGRLEVLAARFVDAAPQDSVHETPPEWNISPLFRMIDAGLRRLEEASV